MVSPAPAGGNTNWFDPFFEACENLGFRIDYLATHDYVGDVDKVMDKLELLYNRYGKKIWLTEFAVCCTREENDVINFVKVVFLMLESLQGSIAGYNSQTGGSRLCLQILMVHH